MSRPIVDHKGRRRCKTVAFRISPEEADQLDLKVALSGLSKQDYITKCLLESKFTVSATVRMRKTMKEQIGLIVAELRRIVRRLLRSRRIARGNPRHAHQEPQPPERNGTH